MNFRWKLHGDGKRVGAEEIVWPDERLSWFRTIGLGMQHVVAMFGATFLVPILTGFPPATTLFFSGVGTLIFLTLTKNRLPSYLGSSFAFLAPVSGAMAMETYGGIPAALFGILVVGLLLAIVGIIVQAFGMGWVDWLMPPVVMGAIVALIGFNLAPTAGSKYMEAPVTATITLASIVLITVLFKGMIARLSIFLGVLVGYAVAIIRDEVDFSAVEKADWVGLPTFTMPANPFENPALWGLIPAFLPVVFVLVAENVGHVKSVAQMTTPKVNETTGRALFADGVATVVASLGGGSGTTTYGENIGVMAATRVYSTAAYWVAGIFAILLGMSPKFGEIINTIPDGVLGGVTTALYGLIGIIGVKIWMDNKVDFAKPVNQFTAATALIVGIADFTFKFGGGVVFNGIALGTLAAIVIYHVMNWISKWRNSENPDNTDIPIR